MPLDIQIILLIFGSGVFMGLFFGALFTLVIKQRMEWSEPICGEVEEFTAGGTLKSGQVAFFGTDGKVYPDSEEKVRLYEDPEYPGVNFFDAVPPRACE